MTQDEIRSVQEQLCMQINRDCLGFWVQGVMSTWNRHEEAFKAFEKAGRGGEGSGEGLQHLKEGSRGKSTACLSTTHEHRHASSGTDKWTMTTNVSLLCPHNTGGQLTRPA